MVHVSILDSTESTILLTLLRSSRAMSGRAIARVAGLSQSTAQRALIRLRNSGLIVVDDVPPALLYRANTDHLAMPAITELLSLRERLAARAADEIASWVKSPISAVLYGSVARNESHAGSDVDVLLVRPAHTSTQEPTWESQVTRLSELLTRWTGRPASVIEVSSSELRRGLSEKEPYLVSAATEGMLLFGRRLTDVARRTG